MTTHKLSLSAALKTKNRIAGELARLQNILKRDNSRVESKPLRSNLAEVVEAIEVKTKDLIRIKSAIAKANVDIYETLATLEEAKAKITFLNSLPVVEGEVSEGYGPTPVIKTYVSFFNQGDVDSQVKAWQKEADIAQDKIDAHNATHSITVDLSE